MFKLRIRIQLQLVVAWSDSADLSVLFQCNTCSDYNSALPIWHIGNMEFVVTTTHRIIAAASDDLVGVICCIPECVPLAEMFCFLLSSCLFQGPWYWLSWNDRKWYLWWCRFVSCLSVITRERLALDRSSIPLVPVSGLSSVCKLNPGMANKLYILWNSWQSYAQETQSHWMPCINRWVYTSASVKQVLCWPRATATFADDVPPVKARSGPVGAVKDDDEWYSGDILVEGGRCGPVSPCWICVD